MSNRSEHVKEWRKKTKERIILAMGKYCQCCGYDKCDAALELHHIDPTEKELSFGRIRANPISWNKICKELQKCILVCANCHRELHNNERTLPDKYAIFDNNFLAYKKVEYAIISKCPICGNDKPKNLITCSLKCSAVKRFKVEWDKWDLNDLINIKKLSMCKIADLIGVSDNGVRKRAKKLGIIQ